jgi:lia operon protein LiaF
MKRRVWGLILIALGVLALLQGIGVYEFGLAFWPVILVLVGGALVWGSLRPWFGSWLRLGLGLWLGAIGLFAILSNAGVTAIAGGDIARYGWPFLLVALGISILFGGRGWFSGWCCSSSRLKHNRLLHAARAKRCHLGDLYHGRESWILDGDLDLQHGIGDIVLDLTTAEISEGAHRITVGASIGELLIRVPDHVNVEVDASVSLGELKVFAERRTGIGGLALQRKIPAADSRADLYIEARLGIGELAVVQAPASPGGAR